MGLAYVESRRPWAVFFFQAEDGIRDHCVTGVQTCALPISLGWKVPSEVCFWSLFWWSRPSLSEIGRASCRERCGIPGVACHVIKKRGYLPTSVPQAAAAGD